MKNINVKWDRKHANVIRYASSMVASFFAIFVEFSGDFWFLAAVTGVYCIYVV